MIYTTFGEQIEIIGYAEHDNVVNCQFSDNTCNLYYLNELKADNGINEIMQAIEPFKTSFTQFIGVLSGIPVYLYTDSSSIYELYSGENNLPIFVTYDRLRLDNKLYELFNF